MYPTLLTKQDSSTNTNVTYISPLLLFFLKDFIQIKVKFQTYILFYKIKILIYSYYTNLLIYDILFLLKGKISRKNISRKYIITMD
jgi:hypothetical protein